MHERINDQNTTRLMLNHIVKAPWALSLLIALLWLQPLKAQIVVDELTYLTRLSGTATGTQSINKPKEVQLGLDATKPFATAAGSNISIYSEVLIQLLPGTSIVSGSSFKAAIGTNPNKITCVFTPEPTASYTISNEPYLKIYYEERYRSADKLNFKLKNSLGADVSSQVSFFEKKPIGIGGNVLQLNIKGLAEGIYTMEVVDWMQQKWYLVFAKKN